MELNDFEYKCVRCLTSFKEKYDIKRHMNRKNLCQIINPILLEKEYTKKEMEDLINTSYERCYSEEEIYIKSVDDFDDMKEENKTVCRYCFKKYGFVFVLNDHLKTCRKKDIYEKIKKKLKYNYEEPLNIIDKATVNLEKIFFSDYFDTSHIDEEMMNKIVLKCSLLFTFSMIMTNEKNHNFYINKEDNIYKIYDKEGIKEVLSNIIYNKIFYEVYIFYKKGYNNIKLKKNIEYHPDIFKILNRNIENEYFFINSELNRNIFFVCYEKYNELVKELFI